MVWHAVLWAIMKKYNISTNLIRVIRNLYDKATSAVLFSSSIENWFRATVGVRQGSLLSPTLFNIFLERIMTDALEDHDGTVSIRGRAITNLRFPDDTEVHAKIQQAIGPYEDLLTIVKRRKLQLYGHVTRSSGLAKTFLQGTVKRRRRQSRQRKRWGDNIREWTGLEFGKSQRAVENREKWRKLVAKSAVRPQRPSRLRDR